jgi:hypothetical protein
MIPEEACLCKLYFLAAVKINDPAGSNAIDFRLKLCYYLGMEQSYNPVADLIAIEKQNQVLLETIVVNQELILGVEQDRKSIENRKFIWEFVKYGLFIILIFISFSFTQGLVDGLMSNMMGTVNNKNIDLNDLMNNGTVEDLLKTMQ